MWCILHVFSEKKSATRVLFACSRVKMEEKSAGMVCQSTRRLHFFLCGGLLGLGSLFPLLLLEVVHVDLDDVGVLDHKSIQILGLHLMFRNKKKITVKERIVCKNSEEIKQTSLAQSLNRAFPLSQIV